MALPPPPLKNAPSTPVSNGLSSPSSSEKKKAEIITIPEKFYGMALKMKAEPEKKKEVTPAPVPTPKQPPQVMGPLPKRRVWPYVVLVGVLILLVGGGFVYFNRTLLFPPPAPVAPPTPEAPVIAAPTTPANLAAVSASGTMAVTLNWVDTSGDETGYRVERREGLQGTFIPLTNLGINSTTFLDVTVVPDRTYTYRVIATGPGGESSPSNGATAQTGAAAQVATPTLPPGGLDSDSDGLTDVEEAVYGTDSHNPDTDGDGFLDGNEVFHLYNPAATAPVRLMDSGIVKQVQASSGWRLLVPKDWVATLTPPDGATATIRTNSGETFTIKLENNASGLSLRDWYDAQNKDSAPNPPREITTKGVLTGLLGGDRLTTYFAWDGKIFVIHYELGTRDFINYRTSYEMILNSLELKGAPILTGATNDALVGPGDFIQTTSTMVPGEATTTAVTTSSQQTP